MADKRWMLISEVGVAEMSKPTAQRLSKSNLGKVKLYHYFTLTTQ